VIGGHPRALEFVDALLRGGEARFPAVAEKLRRIAGDLELDLSAPPDSLDEAMQTALAIAAGDVLLEELLAIARREGLAEILLQAAVSNLPVTPEGLARMLASDATPSRNFWRRFRDGLARMLAGEGAVDVQSVHSAIGRLESLSLLHRFPDAAVWVHRWTAEVLRHFDDAAAYQTRAARAGRYRWWRVENESHALVDAIEAVRNFLAARAFDDATGVASACFEVLRRLQQSTGIAALAAEVLETLPETDGAFASVADQEARAHLALGLTDRALERFGQLLRLHERLAQAEPSRADYQRDLSVSYERMGDLLRDLGQSEEARQAFAKSLAIIEPLAQAEPGRADYQRNLAASYLKVGDLFSGLGQGEEARQAFARSLAIRERLAQAEPGRADYQRDLSVSYDRMGDLFSALGQGEEARQAFATSLAISERLAQAEPGRADYQRDLSVSYNKMGDLFRALGQGEEARQAFATSLAIRERLAQAEPGRADYQRDLSVSYERMGDLFRVLGQGEEARQAFATSLAIRERLAQAEPGRADYQRDLIVSWVQMSEIDTARAREHLSRALDIARRLNDEGRLAPVDAWMVDELARRLGEVGPSG
jgi:tetratricopeptide (TPR) repeat protein